MTHTTCQARTHRCSLLQSEGGFALLGYCYFLVIWIVALSTAMLTRSTQDLRTSERTVDLSQAFWTSETGLDLAFNSLLWNPPDTLTTPLKDNPQCRRDGRTNCEASCITSQALFLLNNALSTTYQICLADRQTGQFDRYRIVSQGTASKGTRQATHLIAGEIERRKPVYTFKHAIFALDSIEAHSGVVGHLGEGIGSGGSSSSGSSSSGSSSGGGSGN